MHVGDTFWLFEERVGKSDPLHASRQGVGLPVFKATHAGIPGWERRGFLEVNVGQSQFKGSYKVPRLDISTKSLSSLSSLRESCFSGSRLYLSIVFSLMMLLQAFTILSLSLNTLASPIVQLSHSSTSSLADLALQKVLSDASPIFGYYTKNSTDYSIWMSKYPDSTRLVHSTCSRCSPLSTPIRASHPTN